MNPKRSSGPADTAALSRLYQRIALKPGEAVPLVALAEFYESADRWAAGECLRWTVRNDKRPFLYRKKHGITTVSCDEWPDGRFWWANEAPLVTEPVLNEPDYCKLPRDLWGLLHHSFEDEPVFFKEYPTIRAAYEELIAAWLRLKGIRA